MRINTFIGLGIAVIALVIGSLTVTRAVYYAPEAPGIIIPAEASVTQSVGVEVGGGSTTTTKVTATPAVAPIADQNPSRLLIPAFGIDAHVQYTGVNAKGNMGTPTNFTDVAWYKSGIVPGEGGSAVMDGHVDNGLAKDGVFKHLKEIAVGEDVYVVRNDGVKLHFRVEKVVEYAYDSAPDSSVFVSNDAARLNLITCVGDWIAGEKTYSKRLVVFTKLVK